MNVSCDSPGAIWSANLGSFKAHYLGYNSRYRKVLQFNLLPLTKTSPQV